MAGLHFELVSPARLLFSGEVASVTIPGTEGEMGIYPGHAPVLSTLKPGVVTVYKDGGSTDRIFVQGGMVEVNPQGLTLLAEVAIPMDELDAATYVAWRDNVLKGRIASGLGTAGQPRVAFSYMSRSGAELLAVGFVCCGEKDQCVCASAAAAVSAE